MGRDPHPFYAPPSSIDADGTLRFPGEERRHIEKAVRLKPGDCCRVVDGAGGLYLVRLEEEEGAIVGRVQRVERQKAPAVRIEVGFPAIRIRSRADWMVEKAVEVGADALIPIRWSRSIRTASDAAIARWRRIAREAMKQAERRWLPPILPAAEPCEGCEGASLILADPDGMDRIPDLPATGTVRLLVGPEGGLTEAEREGLLRAGAVAWRLGPHRLRAETAMVVGTHRLVCARCVDEPGGH